MKSTAVIFLLFALAANALNAVNAFSREERKKEASTLREAIAEIDHHIPNLSPDAKAFLASEQKEIGKIEDQKIRTKRQLALYETKEAQISKVKSLCTEGLRAMDFALRDSASEEQELLGWLAFVTLFMDPITLDDGIMVLESTGVLSKADIESMAFIYVSPRYGELLSGRAKSVMEDIVMPLYERKLRKPNQ